MSRRLGVARPRAWTGVGTPPRVLTVVVKVALTLLYVIPLLWIILEALKSGSETLTAPDAVFFAPTLSTLRSVIGEAGGSVLLSLEVSAAATAAVILFGVPAAYALARRASPRWGGLGGACHPDFLADGAPTDDRDPALRRPGPLAPARLGGRSHRG
jgi:ABC-type glycerol-3-phosphate transport system permease component